MYINKAMIYGNITRDPEIKAIASGSKVCTFSVATNRVWKDKTGAKQEGVDYHNIVLFGRMAENAAQYLKKGSSVYVEGRIQNRSWDAPDGQKKYKTEIVADSMQFGPKGAGGGYQKSTQGGVDEKDNSPAPTIDYPEEEINPDDIPF
jgi:single-strand DNA-binding protein